MVGHSKQLLGFNSLTLSRLFKLNMLAMRQRKSNRQAIFHLISKLEDMLEKGGAHFPSEDPYHDLINYFEGEYLLDRAIELSDLAIRQYGLSPKFYLRKAELLLQNKQAEKALATLDRVDYLTSGSLDSSLLRAEGLASLGMETEAISLLDELKYYATSEELSKIYTQEALIYYQQKNHEKEFYTLKAALQEDHSNKEALSRMWFCVESARRHEESLELHEKILDQDPFCSLAWYNTGAAHQYLCNHEEAIEAYEYAFITNEHFEFAYRQCADVCMYTGKYQKALECYKEVLDRFEADDDLFLCIGLCYKETGNYPVARTFFDKALRSNPMNDEAMFQIGNCYAGQKKWDKAIKAFLGAILENSLNEEYFAAVAEAFYVTGKLRDAEIHFRAAADIAADDAKYWIRLARFFMDTQRLQEALNVLDEAEEYTFGSELLYYRSAFLFKMGKKRDALLVLEEALCEDFYAHGSMFSVMPMMAKDSEVKAVISIFEPD
ncbi:MAG TPA: tetratricopeptide repeat protein [Bacteroidetes bacterium]|nr:tetratricopeptide repeat protein [Bacteroidota bacterium]